MEDKLRARVETAGKKKRLPQVSSTLMRMGDNGRDNWKTEPREREETVLQRQVWIAGSNNLGGAGVQRREVTVNGPWLQGGAKATVPSRDATRFMDPLVGINGSCHGRNSGRSGPCTLVHVHSQDLPPLLSLSINQPFRSYCSLGYEPGS